MARQRFRSIAIYHHLARLQLMTGYYISVDLSPRAGARLPRTVRELPRTTFPKNLKPPSLLIEKNEITSPFSPFGGLLEKQLRSLTSLLSQASLFLSVVSVPSLRLRLVYIHTDVTLYLRLSLCICIWLSVTL